MKKWFCSFFLFSFVIRNMKTIERALTFNTLNNFSTIKDAPCGPKHALQSLSGTSFCAYFKYTVYVKHFTKAMIELIEVNAFLICESTYKVKFNATWKIQHYYMPAYLLYTKLLLNFQGCFSSYVESEKGVTTYKLWCILCCLVTLNASKHDNKTQATYNCTTHQTTTLHCRQEYILEVQSELRLMRCCL